MSATGAPPHLVACKPFSWTLVIRKLDLPPKQRKVKLVAYTLATYADFDDGGNVRPGLKRLARDTGYSERWVQDSLKTLREHWLLYRHQRGSNSGKANLVDIHQLCLPADWETRLPLVSDEVLAEADDPWAPQ